MSTLTLNLDERHDAVLTSLAAEQDISKTALLRTALRLYQTVHEETKRGRQLAFQNADGSFISLVMLGGPMAAESTPPPAGAQQAVADQDIRNAFYDWCPYDGKERSDLEIFSAGYRTALAAPAAAQGADDQRRDWERVRSFAMKIMSLMDSKECANSSVSGFAHDAGERASWIDRIARKYIAAPPAPEAAPSAKEGEWRFFNVYADTEVRNAADNKLLAVICGGPDKKRIVQALKGLTPAGGDRQ